MTRIEYEAQVNPEFCGIQSYMQWVKFSDSFPPLPIEPLPKIRFYEFFFDGSIKVVGMYRRLGKDNVETSHSAFFRDILRDGALRKRTYWRYLPPAPDDTWYEDSDLDRNP